MGAWLVPSVESVTLLLGVVSVSPMLTECRDYLKIKYVLKRERENRSLALMRPSKLLMKNTKNVGAQVYIWLSGEEA